MPSLHVMGKLDYVLPLSNQLASMYDPEKRSSIIHNEGHNIPTVRSNTYDAIKHWIDMRQTSSDCRSYVM